MPLDADYMPFWGKSFIDEHGVHQTHPLVFHCLDVAAVADALLCEFPERRLFLARLLNVEPGVAHGFIVRLIALHDIGKFHPGFQGKLPGYCEQHLPHLAPHIRPGAKRHDLLGFLISQEIGLLGHFQEQLLDWQVTDFDTVFRAIAFHHGAPGDCDSNDNTWCKSVGLIEPAMLAFIEDIKAIIPCPGLLPFHSAGKLGIFSWALAGLTVLADWIGSNSEIFTFPQPNALALHEYWPLARERADRAVHEAGILSALPAILRDPVELLPTPRGSEAKAPQASPLQRAAFEAVFTDGPQLFIIEDMTGAGKTEAALILASRLLSEGRAAGLYFALPTMATANAMYDRMATIYRRLFAENEMPSLVLAHGRRAMNDGFTASIFDGMARATPGAGDEAEPSEAACAAWIADDRRKSFFAHIGAGTIDQALLSVLPSRHQSLRLWGLADRVLIVDEAQNLTPRAVEELRMLSNFQFGKQALLQTFLVGQPEFREILQHPNMQQLRQRVTATCHIGPLDVEETRGYIEHRLKCAGGTGKPEFGEGVFDAIYKATGGIPRRINSVCDRLLLLGFLGDKEKLTLQDVEEVVNELQHEGGAGAGRLVSSMASLETSSYAGVADELVDIDLAKLQHGLAPFADSLAGQLSTLSAEHHGDRLQRLERSLLRLERVNLEILSMLQKMVAAVRR